jgi:nicotinamidase-related amidase
MEKVLLIIDPQKDFMTSPDFSGSLSVNGAYEDMLKLSSYILSENPDSIILTLDTHDRFDIAHHSWWIDSSGNHPSPFTLITVEDVENKVWKPVDNSKADYALFYVKELKKNNKYNLLIWPDHCILGTEGHKVNDELNDTLKSWEEKNNKEVIYINKGTNPNTEHYSGLKAEVVLEEAEETHLNMKLINKLNEFSYIEIAGEALSHCVGNTALDLIENLSPENRVKVSMLTDCMSSVSGFEKNGEEILSKIVELGGNLKQTKKPKLTI